MNTKADCEYFFRPTICLHWRPVGSFLNDCDAKAAIPGSPLKEVATATAGRLAVRIGDFMFPVNDLENGKWIRTKTRKSYDQNRGVKQS